MRVARRLVLAAIFAVACTLAVGGQVARPSDPILILISFDAWRWEELARVPELIVPFKRPVYEEIAAAFSKFACAESKPKAGQPQS